MMIAKWKKQMEVVGVCADRHTFLMFHTRLNTLKTFNNCQAAVIVMSAICVPNLAQ